MPWDRIWDFVFDLMIQIGMPLVVFYHGMTANLFLDTAAENAYGLEKAGDQLLVPYQYLFAGKTATLQDDGSYHFTQRFDYGSYFYLKTAAAVVTLPPSVVLGAACKGLAYLDPQVRAHHKILSESLTSGIRSHLAEYRNMGLSIGDPANAETYVPQKQARRPGDENHLAVEKEALREIGRTLNAAQIPWWIDCGTCLGAYRYGGAIPWDFDIDIALLLPDFDNVMKALRTLDPQKYIVQDWSGRESPQTYLKVYVCETKMTIDVYFFAIDQGQLHYIFSNEKNIFLPEWFKVTERHYTAPVAADVIFPLKKCSFDGVEVFVPNQIEPYLKRYYGDNLSPVKIYNAATGHYEKDITHPYWKEAFAH